MFVFILLGILFIFMIGYIYGRAVQQNEDANKEEKYKQALLQANNFIETLKLKINNHGKF